MAVLSLVDEKYLGNYTVEENLDDYKELFTAPARVKRRSNSKVSLQQAQEKFKDYLVKLMLDANVNVITTLGEKCSSKNDLRELLGDFTLADLFYLRRALKEYKELGKITKEDFYKLDVEVDKDNMIEGQLIMKLF
jgi:hypothetical protein